MLYVDSAGSLTVGGNLINGIFDLIGVDDNASLGGSSVKVAGTVNNTGTINIGRTGSGQTTFTANAVINSGIPSSGGSIVLDSSPTATTVFSINAPAGFGTAGTVTGFVSLNGNSLLEFASGQLHSVAINSFLDILDGTSYVADAGSTTSNSALTGLSSVAGAFYLDYGASVTTSGALANTGIVSLDANGASLHPAGKSVSLTVGGALNNASIGSVSGATAEIDVYGDSLRTRRLC